ncbi:MAG: T9SS type A sorting domain-containing protein [Chitinophagaceae bacterium]|nr:T9SS type A sorting domain-containing protein [Chitinophagaceae bacterium]
MTGGGVGTVGPLNPTIGTISASNIAVATQRMYFDVLAPVQIVSVDIYPTATIGSAGSITIRNNTQTVIADIPYTTTVTGGSVQTVPLNISLPPGTGYEMGQGTAINLNRNTTGAVYPYTSSAINITGNSFDPAYYYFYYNWQFATGCESARTAVVATINPPPAVFNVTGGGNYCSGGSGVSIGLDNSETGVNYQLFNGASAAGAPVPGTGAAISFGSHTAAGSYTVVATNTTTNCSSNMTGVATVTIDPLPAVFNVTGGGNYCSGGSGVSIGLDNSETGVNYQLFNGASAAGAPVPGTGAAISFGSHTAAGSYTVVATNTTTNCSSNMTGVATVTIDPLPAVFNVTGGGNYCSGGSGVSIGLDNSETGVNYQLFNGASAAGAPVPGTGAAISFGSHTAAGSYTVVATNTTTNCSSNMTGAATVTIDPLPAVFNVTGGGNYCSGGGGVSIGLDNSETGVNYQLFNGASAAGAPVPGTGAAISFGSHTAAGSYTVVATNTTTNCSSNMTGAATVTVLPLPVPIIAGPASVCIGSAGNIYTTEPGKTGYVWTISGGGSITSGGTSTDNTVTVTWNTAGPQTVSVNYTDVNNCAAATSTIYNVSVNPLPVIGSSVTEPTTCTSTDGAINLTITGAAGPFSFSWSTIGGSGLVAGAEDQTALTVGQYTVVVTDQVTGCQQTASFTLTGPGGCAICPTVGSLTTNPPVAACANSTVTLTASGLTSMGIAYGIEFKASPVPLPDPYTGGSVIATVPNAGLTGGGTIATTNVIPPTPGTFHLYAVLTPAPADPACRPFATLSVVVNPVPTVDPVANQVVCNNETTTAISFTGSVSGTNYNWTNDIPSIGLAASGTGDIAAFTAINTGSTPVIATVTVTPVHSSTVPVSETFVYTGAMQTWTVPAGVTQINIAAKGAQGGSNAGGVPGGLGGEATGILNITPGQVLTLYVGGSDGFNGGGLASNTGCASSLAGHGGGASDIRVGGSTLTDRVIVAAGGGGAGGNRVAGCGRGSGGGGGAGYYGGGGGAAWPYNSVILPTGGTQTAGGIGGVSDWSALQPGNAGQAGSLGAGGNGGIEAGSNQAGSGMASSGGTGGGLTGADGQYAGNFTGQSGAGGSSYIDGVTGGITSAGINSGNGSIVISYNSVVTCTGTPASFTITVNPKPTITPGVNPIVCAGTTSASLPYTATNISSGGNVVFYSQTGSTSNGSPSQNFEASFDAYDCESADDFTVPPSETWQVNRVYVEGTGTGTPNSFNVMFYANAGTFPGAVISSFTNVTTFTGSNGTYTITLPSSATLPGGNTYWVSVQNNMDFNVGGQWFWSNFGTTNIGSEYAWRNPGGGFGTSCSGFGPGSTGCGVGGGVSRNNVFILSNTGGAGGTYSIVWSGPALAQGFVNVTNATLPASPISLTLPAGALPGTYTGTITVTNANGCTSAPVETFTVTINPIPTVNSVSNQTVCNGNPTTAVSFSGTVAGTVYNWTNDNTSIGLSASGTGTIAAFTATNTSTTPVTATITVTPSYTNGVTCTGTPVTFTITVNPTATVNTVANQTVCSGATTTAVTFSSPTTGGTIIYNWTNNAPSIGLPASGTGNIAAFTAANAGTAPVTATITVTPVFTNGVSCSGTPVTFTITVNPTATVNTVANQAVCNGATTTAVTFSSPTTGGTIVYNWTNNTPSIGLPASGTGNIAAFIATNTGTAPVTATITVTPVYTNGVTCTGTPRTFTITVNPIPNAVATPATQTICSNSAMTTIVLSGNVAGTTFNWTRDNTTNVTGIPNSGSGNINGTPVNNTTGQQTVIFTITPTANGCTGTPVTATVVINKAPTIVCPANITAPSVVGGCTAIVSYTPTVTGSPAPTLTYTLSGATTGSGTGSGSGLAFTVGVTTVTVTATNSCGTASCSFTVTITDSQLPVISAQPANRTVCAGSNATFSVTASNVVSYQWQTWNGTAWVNITGANTASYTVANVASSMNTSSYRVILNGLCTVVTSNHATLYVNPLPNITLDAAPAATIWPNQTTTITATATPSGGSFAWTWNGSAVSGVSGSVLGPLSIDKIGDYRVSYTDLNGCVNSSALISITPAASDNNIWVYPNPNTGQFNVRYYNQNGEKATLRIYNATGQVVFEQALSLGIAYTNTPVNIFHVAAGVYIVKIVNSEGRALASRRIIVNH